VAGTRWWNVKHPAAYVERLRAGQSPAVGREVLDADTRAVEEILLGVRMAQGLRVADLTPAQQGEVDVLVSDGLGSVTGGRFRLTRSGRLLADAVVRRLVS
jgi:oxygen-independent coproporphyrinogen-3 oxidase